MRENLSKIAKPRENLDFLGPYAPPFFWPVTHLIVHAGRGMACRYLKESCLRAGSIITQLLTNTKNGNIKGPNLIKLALLVLVYACVYKCVFMLMCLHICGYVCVCVCMFVFMYAFMHVCVCVCLYMCMCV